MGGRHRSKSNTLTRSGILVVFSLGLALGDPPTCDTQNNEPRCTGTQICGTGVPGCTRNAKTPCTLCKDGYGIGCKAGEYCRCTWNWDTSTRGHCVNSPDPPGKIWTGWMGFFQNKPGDAILLPTGVVYTLGLGAWVALGLGTCCRAPWKLPGKRYIGPMEAQGLVPPLEEISQETWKLVAEEGKRRRDRELSARSTGIF